MKIYQLETKLSESNQIQQMMTQHQRSAEDYLKAKNKEVIAAEDRERLAQ